MSRRHDASDGPASVYAPRRAGRYSAGAFGVLGSVTCAASMILAAVGVGSATVATSMAGMTGTGPSAPGGTLGALVRAGPWLMLVSGLLVATAFALSRRPVTAIPALLAGAVLYAGMYAQPSLPVMYASIAVGYLAWAALALWTALGRRSGLAWIRPPKAHAARGITQDLTTRE